MVYLSEELAEIKAQGEILLCMDANAKIILLDEPKSRNGKLIEEVFQERNIYVINRSEKCKGRITRQNRCKEEEKSAINFVTASYIMKEMISLS